MANFDLDIKNCFVRWDSIWGGLTLFHCRSPRIEYPIGFVIGAHKYIGMSKKGKMLIVASHIINWARRQGVRTLINETIFNDFGCEIIYTDSGSKDGGMQFMKKSGYKYDKNLGYYFLTKENFKKSYKEWKLRHKIDD